MHHVTATMRLAGLLALLALVAALAGPAHAVSATVIARGGWLRSAPRAVAATAVAQVCPGDAVTVLERRQVGGRSWTRVRVTALAPDCGGTPRAAAGSEGWVHPNLLPVAAPAQPAAPPPTAAPAPTAAAAQPLAPAPTAAPAQPTAPPPPAAPARACDPSYPDLCIPPGSPDLDCGDLSARNFRVVGADPHRLDRDRDGVGCES